MRVTKSFLFAFPLWTDQPGRPRWSFEGLYSGIGSPWAGRWLLLGRSGSIEVGGDHLLDVAGAGTSFDAAGLEDAIVKCLARLAPVIDGGLMVPPLLMSVRLLSVQGSVLGGQRAFMRGFGGRCDRQDVEIEPMLVTNWEKDSGPALRRIFDVIWQAWGVRRSPCYNPDGTRIAVR